MIRSANLAALAAVVQLSACSGMRTAAPPPPTEVTPAPAASPQAPTAPADAEQAGAMTNQSAEAPAANESVQNCVQPESQSKPKLASKPKPARKQTLPSPPAAPAAAQSGTQGSQDAQVRVMPIPVVSILGKEVRDPKGADLGRVVDVLADASGRVRIAIIDFGGFLGVGDQRIAVDWRLLRFNPDGHDTSVLLSVGRDKLKTAPEYRNGPRPQTLMEPDSAASPPATSTE